MMLSSSQSAVVAPLQPLGMDWITESSGQGQKGRVLYFPETEVRHCSQSGGKGVLQLAIVSRSIEDSTVNLVEGMDQFFLKTVTVLSEVEASRFCPTNSDVNLIEGLDQFFLRTVTVPTEVEASRFRSNLLIPSFCGIEDYTPHPEIAERIKAKCCRWGSSFVARGEISYLQGFWEWSLRTQKRLRNKRLHELCVFGTKDFMSFASSEQKAS